ncbi:hypothetical protein E2C01_061385 [Portunus trituberculatus]|uniref:Uncharacterized protein n=1 Tax=Portunus trituberculatus TaxID=210409 RepID=A0A5B7HB55_PORTR|nr:hypothetical protein [Portunus trituberculatus]
MSMGDVSPAASCGEKRRLAGAGGGLALRGVDLVLEDPTSERTGVFDIMYPLNRNHPRPLCFFPALLSLLSLDKTTNFLEEKTVKEQNFGRCRSTRST